VTRTSRPKIPISTQVRVLFRDRWICHWCHRPTVFPLALKYLDRFVKGKGYTAPIAYYDFRYRRDAAPLLDHLAAVIDHVKPFSKGGDGDEQNLVVACNKCNMRKTDRLPEDHVEREPDKPVKGRYGEPKHWDGLASLFLVLGRDDLHVLTPNEREWFYALEEFRKSTEVA
jgi:hypothetical protein